MHILSRSCSVLYRYCSLANTEPYLPQRDWWTPLRVDLHAPDTSLRLHDLLVVSHSLLLRLQNLGCFSPSLYLIACSKCFSLMASEGCLLALKAASLDTLATSVPEIPVVKDASFLATLSFQQLFPGYMWCSGISQNRYLKNEISQCFHKFQETK